MQAKIPMARDYYGVTRGEVVFLIELCEICERKAGSKSKGPLKPTVSLKIFERIQRDLLDMRSTPDEKYKWICHMVCHFSKIRMMVAMENKEAATVARVVHPWICTYAIMDILQSDNGTEFKGYAVSWFEATVSRLSMADLKRLGLKGWWSNLIRR